MVVVIDCRPSYGTSEDHKLWRFIPVSFRNESARLKCTDRSLLTYWPALSRTRNFCVGSFSTGRRRHVRFTSGRDRWGGDRASAASCQLVGWVERSKI